MWMATIGVIITYWMGNVTIRTSSLVILFACAVPIPHVLMISWVVYNLVRNIRCFRQGLVALKTSAASLLLGERMLGTQQSLLPDRLENSSRYKELTTSAGQVNQALDVQ